MTALVIAKVVVVMASVVCLALAGRVVVNAGRRNAEMRRARWRRAGRE